jgi:hypothetical protein
MAALYIYTFLAGLFAADGVPNFIKGITGQTHQTPFGRPSSAIVNVIWGWANLVVAGVLLYFAHPRVHELRAGAVFAASVLIMSVLLAHAWSDHPEHNKAHTK